MDGKNTKKLPVSKEEVLQKYKQFHTDPKSETRKEWKSLLATGRDYLAIEKYFKKFKYFDLNSLLYELSTKSEDTSTRKGVFFKDILKALQKLENYGLKLLKRPWRREFYTIKLFTTFYKHEIESKIPTAPGILGLYGYKEQSQNILKVTSPLDLDKILNVSFELFLASIELKVLFEIWNNIEEYTDDLSLISVLELRERTLGDMNEALESFLDSKPFIKKAKRFKTDDMEAAEKSKLRRAAEVENSSAVDLSNWKVSQGKSKRDTKYPPTYGREYSSPVDAGVTAVPTKARVQHISSSSIDNFTDAELYGHTNASPSSRDKENHIPMETEEHTSPSAKADYDPNLYVDMSGAAYDDYEMMDMYGATNEDASCTTLPPPDYQYRAQDPGIPPPTYSQAVQLPGNDWVMVQDHQFGREDKHSDPLTNTIPGFSAMNIGGNRPGSGSRSSSEILSRSTYDTNKLPPPKTSKTLSAEKADKMLLSNAHSHLESVHLGGNTRSRTFSAPDSKDAMRQREVSSKPPITNGLDYRSQPFSTREPDKRKFHENVNLHSEKPEDSLKSRADSEGRSGSLGVYENIPTSKTKDQYPASGVTRTESRELSSKAIRDTHVITATEPFTTASYSKVPVTSVTSSLSSYKTRSTGVTTRSQAKEIAASRSFSEPLQQSSSRNKVTKRSDQDNCYICSKEATHYCESCDKRSCKDCVNVVTRLSCESYKEHHFVEGRPSSSKDQKNRCSFCDAKTPYHMCIYCRKQSCENCHNLYKTDRCFSKESKFHYFVDQESQKLSSERKEGTPQKLATPALKDNTPHTSSLISGENICDFCRLAATLICKTCLKPVCNTCVYVYEQDLCPPTKKEHQFENIVAQSSNTNGTPPTDSDSPWACERCTFLNSPSHRICAVCAASRGVKEAEAFPESGTRRCANCTYGNEQGATVCKMCSCTIGLDRPESYI